MDKHIVYSTRDQEVSGTGIYHLFKQTRIVLITQPSCCYVNSKYHLSLSLKCNLTPCMGDVAGLLCPLHGDGFSELDSIDCSLSI